MYTRKLLPDRHLIQIFQPPMKISCCHRNAHHTGFPIHRPFVLEDFLNVGSEERFLCKSCLDTFVIINKLIQHSDKEIFW